MNEFVGYTLRIRLDKFIKLEDALVFDCWIICRLHFLLGNSFLCYYNVHINFQEGQQPEFRRRRKRNKFEFKRKLFVVLENYGNKTSSNNLFSISDVSSKYSFKLFQFRIKSFVDVDNVILVKSSNFRKKWQIFSVFV